MNKDILWLWYLDKSPITKKIKYDLYKHFGDIKALYEASKADYSSVEYLSEPAIESLCDKNLDQYTNLCDLYNRNEVTLLSIDKEEYPALLNHLNTPPLLLYCRGKFINLNERLCISVVGSRKVSEYGKICTKKITKDLAEGGAVIVSGMAYGVDSCAHWAALDAGMPTVAVVGTGVNIVYPKSNARLMKEIIKTGMVISEYPLNTEAEKYHFPERNRIISALSGATLVVEANIKSGSLITAGYALEVGRDVYAVPGNINTINSTGTNALIRDGAYLTTCGEDILQNMRPKYSDLIINGMNDRIRHNNIEENIVFTSQTDNTENIEENIIKNLDESEPTSIDELCEKSGISIATLNQKLLLMELSGKIKKHPGNSYTK